MSGASRGRLPCLDEHTLAAVAEGQIEGCTLEPLEAHLAECDDCREVLARAGGELPSPIECSSPPSSGGAEALSSGTRVGRYIIEGLVGRGAMGEVYAATDPDLHRKVAVKLLRADVSSAATRHQTRARLLREAQAMARLSHPDVITVHDVGALGDRLFVAMEYVEGQTLRQWRAERHRRYDEILDAYERAGSGLAAAHEAGLVHRDFKPDNVLVARDGRVRVTDFGLARTVDEAVPSASPVAAHIESSDSRTMTMTLTRTGTLLGTPAYMAPEQLRGRAADARSDVFSFCVALYEALYRERPFPGSTVPLLLLAIDEGRVRASPVMTRVPTWVRPVLLRGLRAGPDERFASMRALLDALRAAHTTSRRRVARVAGVTVVALLGLAGTIAMSTRGTVAGARRDSPAFALPPVLSGVETAGGAVPLARPIVAQYDDLRNPGTSHPADANPRPAPPENTRLSPAARRALISAPGAPAPASSRRPRLVGRNGALILE